MNILLAARVILNIEVHFSLSQSIEMDVSDIKPSTSATIHGVIVGELSPLKQGRKQNIKYFDGTLSDGIKKARMISFEPKFHEELLEKKKKMVMQCKLRTA